MKSRIFDLGIDLKGAYAPLDRRYAERAALQARVLYASEDGTRLLKAEGALIARRKRCPRSKCSAVRLSSTRRAAGYAVWGYSAAVRRSKRCEPAGAP